MKIQCARCKEIVPLEFVVATRGEADGSPGIDVHCSSCQQTYFVAPTEGARDPGVVAGAGGAGEHAELGAAAEAPATRAKRAVAPPAAAGTASDAASGAADRCPRCGADRPARGACRRCGLLVERWAELVSSEPAGPEPVGAGETAALWQACEQQWDDRARHDAFLAHHQKVGDLAGAAARYRALLEARGGEDRVCRERLAQIRGLAELALARSPTSQEPRGGRSVRASWLVLGAAIAAIVGLSVYFSAGASSRRDAPGRPAPRPAGSVVAPAATPPSMPSSKP